MILSFDYFLVWLIKLYDINVKKLVYVYIYIYMEIFYEVFLFVVKELYNVILNFVFIY